MKEIVVTKKSREVRVHLRPDVVGCRPRLILVVDPNLLAASTVESGGGVQALVGDGVLQIQDRDRLDLDIVAEILVLKRNDLVNIADDQAEAAEAVEAEIANQDLILLIIDVLVINEMKT